MSKSQSKVVSSIPTKMLLEYNEAHRISTEKRSEMFEYMDKIGFKRGDEKDSTLIKLENESNELHSIYISKRTDIMDMFIIPFATMVLESHQTEKETDATVEISIIVGGEVK